MAPRAIVIGSGVGGSAAALLLAHAGIPTTLLEKNRRLGGSCAGYEKRGFRIDLGTHMFSRGPKGPLGDVLRRVGKDGAIRFVRTHDIAEIRMLDRSHQDIQRLPVPAELHRLPAFAWRAARALGLSLGEAMRVGRFFAHLLAMSEDEIDAWQGRTVDELVAAYTSHAPTIGLFGFLLGLYFILPYWEVSAGEAVWCFQQMARDNWLSYPIGGSRAVPETYARLAGEHGADVRTGAGVRRVLVQDGRVTGVELSDGTTLPASVVVSTSSVKTTVLHLVGPEHFPTAYVERARRLRGSYVAVQAKIGLRRPLVSAGALVGGVGESVDLFGATPADLAEMFRTLSSGRVPPIVPFYCPVPTNFDPSLAPPGHQLLTVCAVAPTTDVPLGDPGPVWEEAMLRALGRVVPGLEKEALFVDRFSVPFLERWIGKQDGPAVSTAQTPDQVGSNRPTVFTPIRGLYLAGCGAGGRGVGTELAASSAMECVDRILADVGHDLALRPRPPLTAQAAMLASRAALGSIAWATR